VFWRLWLDFDDIILIVWLSVFGSVSFAVLTVVTAASAFVTTLSVVGFLTFALFLVAFFLGLLLSLVVVLRVLFIVPVVSPLVLGLQLLCVIVDVEEVKVAVLVVAEFVSLRLDPSSAPQLIVVQELVAENVFSLDVCHNELSSGLTSIGEWMRSRSISVGVKQFQHDLLTLAISALSGLDTDENRLVIVRNVDESL
jgi:hypothetical protein